MIGINLHDIVRQTIPTLHPDEQVYLFQNNGNINNRGIVTPNFADPALVSAQIQSLTTDDLKALEATARTEHQRRAYLYSKTANNLIPQGIHRPFARGGDIILRKDSTWWLIAGMIEDFSNSGWVCVRIVLQLNAPDILKEKITNLVNYNE